MEVSLSKILGACEAFERIGQSDLPFSNAWKISLLVEKLLAVKKFWETDQQPRLFLKHGGIRTPRGYEVSMPPREKDETDESFKIRQEEFRGKTELLLKEQSEALDERISIDHEKLPLSLFIVKAKNEDGEMVEKCVAKPADLVKLLPFIVDETPH